MVTLSPVLAPSAQAPSQLNRPRTQVATGRALLRWIRTSFRNAGRTPPRLLPIRQLCAEENREDTAGAFTLVVGEVAIAGVLDPKRMRAVPGEAPPELFTRGEVVFSLTVRIEGTEVEAGQTWSGAGSLILHDAFDEPVTASGETLITVHDVIGDTAELHVQLADPLFFAGTTRQLDDWLGAVHAQGRARSMVIGTVRSSLAQRLPEIDGTPRRLFERGFQATCSAGSGERLLQLAASGDPLFAYVSLANGDLARFPIFLSEMIWDEDEVELLVSFDARVDF